MKKLLFLAICLLVAGSVSAQGYYSGHRRAVRRSAPRSSSNDFYRTKIGIAGGFNFADAVDAYNSDYSTAGITAFHVGLTLDIPIAYPLSFAPEVLYSQKGYAATTQDGNFTQRANFIDVPLLAKFRLSPYVNFVVGPQVSFPISTTNTYDDGFNVTTEDHYSTTRDRTVLDGVIGVGFDINPNVEIRARYTIDFQQTDDNAYFIPGYRNEVFQLGIGFKFQ
ncbi:MAG: porin family protein [Mucilaginibacter sp.]